MVFEWQVQHFGMHAALLCGRRWALEVWCLCCVCVACELHGRATQHRHHTSKAQRLPHKRAACIPKCCTCHTNTIGTLIYQICSSDCCHDILHPLSYCQQRLTMPFVSVRGRFFVSTFNNFVLAGRSCWMLIQKIFPGFFKKNSHGTRQASNLRSPLHPPLQSCNWKGLNVPNLNGRFFWRPTATTRNKQLWSWGARGTPRLNLLFYRMAVFYEEPGKNTLITETMTVFSNSVFLSVCWQIQTLV